MQPKLTLVRLSFFYDRITSCRILLRICRIREWRWLMWEVARPGSASVRRSVQSQRTYAPIVWCTVKLRSHQIPHGQIIQQWGRQVPMALQSKDQRVFVVNIIVSLFVGYTTNVNRLLTNFPQLYAQWCI